MVLLQGLLNALRGSAGKILEAIFGWAVLALFGNVSPKERTFLTVVVAAAAVWPLLLVGLIVPKLGALVLAFVPLPHSVPSWVVRAVWAALVLAVPILVGLAVASNSRSLGHEPFVKRLLRGFPITLGLATAIVMLLVVVPILRLVSMSKGWRDEHVPLITDLAHYHVAADRVREVLVRHGIAVARATAPAWITAPVRVLKRLAGKAVSGFLPDDPELFRSADLEVAMYPSDVLLRGKPKRLALAHGLIAEALAAEAALQTFDPRAQALEGEIRSIWQVYRTNPPAHVHSTVLRARVAEIARELAETQLEWDEWQTVYRKLLMVARALGGERPLLERETRNVGEQMEERRTPARFGAPSEIRSRPTSELLGEVGRKAALLAKKEVELAKTEIKQDLRKEVVMAGGLGVAGICALLAVTLLLVAAVFGLATLMPGWLAALIVAGMMMIAGGAAGAIGWAKRARDPLSATRRTLRDDARWAKERLA
jgi:hypothetical protein